jgi:transketolase
LPGGDRFGQKQPNRVFKRIPCKAIPKKKGILGCYWANSMTHYQNLKILAAEIRKLTIQAMESSGYGHIGGAMSICDLLAVLYGGAMHVNPQVPLQPDRDWLVLSKGHCGPALIATLAHQGYFDVSELKTLNATGTKYPNHCDRLKRPAIDIRPGSLGQGLSLASGVAFGIA